MAGDTGIGIDAHGNPVIDPTENVKSLNKAEAKRQDDLREALVDRLEGLLRVAQERADALRLTTVERLDELRMVERCHHTEVTRVQNQRLDDLRAAESRRVDERLQLITVYQEKLASAETRRLDDILKAMNAAVSLASEKNYQQEMSRTAQMQTSAENLRALVTTTSDALARAHNAEFARLNDRIGLVERSENIGAGKGQGLSTAWAVIIGAVGLVLNILVGMGLVAHLFLK